MHHCTAAEFVKENALKITEITENEQLRLFEHIYKDYVKDSIRLYSKYKNQNSVTWENLHQILKDVFVDIIYQGRFNKEMVVIFGENKKESVIKLIKNTPALLSDEKGRNRIPYMMRLMK
jgi:hypothetical protein